MTDKEVIQALRSELFESKQNYRILLRRFEEVLLAKIELEDQIEAMNTPARSWGES